jgi:hypothetical protein
MQKCVKFIDKYELEKLRTRLMVKLYRDIGKKYRSLLTDKEITLEKFNKELKREIERNFDFSNPDYKKFFHEVEKMVLQKLARLPDKRRENIREKGEIESKLRNINYDREEHHLFPEKSKNNRVRNDNKKVKFVDPDDSGLNYKLKSYDDYESYADDTHRNAIAEKIRKQLLNEEMENNFSDRENDEDNDEDYKEEEDSRYHDVLKGTMKKMELEEREHNLKAKETFLKQKEILLSSLGCKNNDN